MQRRARGDVQIKHQSCGKLWKFWSSNSAPAARLLTFCQHLANVQKIKSCECFYWAILPQRDSWQHVKGYLYICLESFVGPIPFTYFYATWKVWFRNYDSSLTTGKDVCKSAWDLLFVPYPLQLHMSQFLCHICITIGKYNVQKKLGLWKFWLSNFASRNSRNIDKDIYRYFCPESFSIWGPSSFELVA